MGTPSPIRHAFIGLEIFSAEGGIQSYVRDLLRAYLAADPDWEADVFLLRDDPQCQNPFVNELVKESRLRFHYCRGGGPQLGRLRLLAKLLYHGLRDRPRRFIGTHLFVAPLMRLVGQPLGIPYTVITHGKEVWQPLAGKRLEALQAADAIWTVSRYSQQRLCEANGIAAEKVQRLPCVVDGGRFTPAPPNLDLVTRYGLANAKVLMTVARLWSGDIYKGVDVTIRALPKILHAQPDVKYLVIGRGDDQPRLVQLAQELGVADQVVFAGFVSDQELVDHYRLASAYVMPSQEGFGIVYLEAMACGVPVLSGDDDGSADPLQAGRMGWQVPHRDPEAVASACLEILRGEDKRCDRTWLRQETLAAFSPAVLAQTLKTLLA
ncbi:MAG: glycosyltransferase family 4 protein [Synechococcales cyanobacterium CRU_2_2]|nr:glycosyltransferase family 4 protein [Synechococcales cyanobacterium CRU_2_2]